MSEPARAVLVVEPDSRVRALVLAQLAGLGFSLFEAADGERAMEILRANEIHLVVTELYLAADGSDCLADAIGRNRSLRHTRVLAHTQFNSGRDRDWAMRVGADAYLIRPVRSARMRDVVSRLASQRAKRSQRGTTPIARRDSLEIALKEKEAGRDPTVGVIVFGREWWSELTRPEQNAFRKRAKKVGVTLRSDALLGNHFVEVRGISADEGLSSERAESPYRA